MLEDAIDEERARKEAEKKAHHEALTKAWANTAKKEAIEARQKKVAAEGGRMEVELRVLKSEKDGVQRAREEEAARAFEEAKR